MTIRDRVVKAIFDAIDRVNEQMPEDCQLEKTTQIVLFGKGGRLDSLGILNLIIAVEEGIEEEFGVALTLANAEAMSRDRSPFKSVETLTNYILEFLPKNGSA